jgi:aquaporin Z
MIQALRQHWLEYRMEAAGLGIFMISASLFTILLEYPGSRSNNSSLRRWSRGL